MRIVIIGQAPSRNGDPKNPVAIPKLARLLGVTFSEYEKLGRFNLLDEWPGKAGKGDAFPMLAARLSAERHARGLRGKRVLLLGRAVAAAFGLRVPYLKWTDHLGFRAAVIPHPSGINRWWNDPRNRARATRFLRDAMRKGKSEGSP